MSEWFEPPVYDAKIPSQRAVILLMAQLKIPMEFKREVDTHWAVSKLHHVDAPHLMVSVLAKECLYRQKRP